MLGEHLRPRLYVEPVGQGDSDKPRHYRYSTVERADLVQALWRHHCVRATVVVTFDYTSLAVLELLRRQLERTASGSTATPVITAALMINGGLFADSHTHPWQGTPLLRTPLGALAIRRWQRSPRAFAPPRPNSPRHGRRSPAGTGRPSPTTPRDSSPSTAATPTTGT
jgi:pimeloyl-ACP methyl ester carboxylesterase